MVQLQSAYQLKNHNTFGVEAVAERFGTFQHLNELTELLDAARQAELEPLILGEGSNMLFTGHVSRAVLHNAMPGISVLDEEDDSVVIEAGGGVHWHDLVLFCVERNWGGIENLALIPGTVGAAPIQNIGAYGAEVAEVVETVTVYDRRTERTYTLGRGDCEFAYRSSIFKTKAKGRYVILSLTLRLTPNAPVRTQYGAVTQTLRKLDSPAPTIANVCKAISLIRQRKLPDPAEIGNAGSFFKNPIIPKHHFERLLARWPEMPNYRAIGGMKVPAAWLIDNLGWKGRRLGNVGVHEHQALVLVHYGGGSGQDVLDLAMAIQEDVQKTYDIALETEVNIIP